VILDMADKRFESSDAWIFLCIHNTKGVNLVDMLNTADYINHAIPTEAEIEGAVNRLSAAGLITCKEELFKLTASGKKIRDRFAPRGKSLLDAWNNIEEHLNSTDFRNLKIPQFKLKSGQLDTAYQTYAKRFRKILKTIESKEETYKDS
jgi:hypothetical protein